MSSKLMRRMFHNPMSWGVEQVKEIVEAEGDIESRDQFKMTPLIRACFLGKSDVVEYLISKNAEINVADFEGNTPLIHSIQQEDVSSVKLLLEKGARTDIVNYEGNSPLYLALETKNTKIAKLVLKYSSVTNTRHANGETLLQKAVMDNFHQIIVPLVKKGAQVNRKTSDYDAPLFLAIDNEYLKCFQELLKCNPNINLLNSDGETPLHCICKGNNVDFLQVLLNYQETGVRYPGLNLEKKNKLGETPLMKSFVYYVQDSIIELLEAGAKANPSLDKNDPNVYPPLFLALFHQPSWKESIPLFHKLMDKGADINYISPSGQTIVDCIQTKEMYEELKRYTPQMSAEVFEKYEDQRLKFLF